MDAGNALFGAESLESQGRVILAAYNALGYDAVNLSYRDFRRGKAATLALVQDAQFAVLSANLLDTDMGQPFVQPYITLYHQTGGKRADCPRWDNPGPGRTGVPTASQGAADRHAHPATP
jgi:hypothetical protein